MSIINYRAVLLISFLAIFARANAMEKLPQNSNQSTKETLNPELEAQFHRALLNYFAAQRGAPQELSFTNTSPAAIQYSPNYKEYSFEDETKMTVENKARQEIASQKIQQFTAEFNLPHPIPAQTMDDATHQQNNLSTKQKYGSRLYFDEEFKNTVLQKQIASEKINQNITIQPNVAQHVPAQPINNASQIVLNPKKIRYGTELIFEKPPKKEKPIKRNKKISQNIIEFNILPAQPIDNSSQVVLKPKNRLKKCSYGTKITFDEPQEKKTTEETESQEEENILN